MIHSLSNLPQATEHSVLRGMFAARKRVFIDLLRWDLPVLAGHYELDQFDTPDAMYIVLTDAAASHRGSARLLPTTKPHLLDTLFRPLCESGIPRGPDCAEISRFCLDRSLGSAGRRKARDELVHALVAHALANGIRRYTGIAEESWLKQILAFGWQCRPLGKVVQWHQARIGALLIDIGEDTPALLERSGIRAHPRGDGACHVH